MLKVINLHYCFQKFSDTFSPKIIAELNGQHIKVVWLEGDKVPWHIHDNEDELFWVLEGVLQVYTQNETVTLHSSEFCIVPKGIEHRVTPQGRVKLILFEPAGIAHTGNVKSEITLDHYDWLDL